MQVTNNSPQATSTILHTRDFTYTIKPPVTTDAYCPICSTYEIIDFGIDLVAFDDNLEECQAKGAALLESLWEHLVISHQELSVLQRDLKHCLLTRVKRTKNKG